MIRAILVAIIPASFSEHTIPCWGVRRELSLKMDWRLWNPGRKLGHFRQGYWAGEAMPQIGR
jgi:hypothetical protein